jgi:3-hydroxyacyl-[acyl-carrier-protein] dehydratase
LPEFFVRVFCFVDRVSEVKKNESLTAFYTLKGREEFLKDHFSGFPVMPGVLLLEALKQAAGELLRRSLKETDRFYRILRVSSVRFGQFVKPGMNLEITARFLKEERQNYFFEGEIETLGTDGSKVLRKALTASFVLVPLGPESQ